MCWWPNFHHCWLACTVGYKSCFSNFNSDFCFPTGPHSYKWNPILFSDIGDFLRAVHWNVHMLCTCINWRIKFNATQVIANQSMKMASVTRQEKEVDKLLYFLNLKMYFFFGHLNSSTYFRYKSKSVNLKLTEQKTFKIYWCSRSFKKKHWPCLFS